MEKENTTQLKNIFKCAGIIILFLFFSSFFFGLLNINPEAISDKTYIIYLACSNAILLAIFLWIYRKTIIRDAKSYFKDFGTNIETSFKYWVAGFGIMVISNLFITFVLNKTIAGNEQQVRSFINISPLLMIFDVVIYAPITEELTFRKSIKDAIKSKWAYVIISGFIFGWLHIMSYINSFVDIIYIIPYASLGITFALLYYKTDNIFSTIIMHSMHNGFAILVYLLGALL